MRKSCILLFIAAALALVGGLCAQTSPDASPAEGNPSQQQTAELSSDEERIPELGCPGLEREHLYASSTAELTPLNGGLTRYTFHEFGFFLDLSEGWRITDKSNLNLACAERRAAHTGWPERAIYFESTGETLKSGNIILYLNPEPERIADLISPYLTAPRPGTFAGEVARIQDRYLASLNRGAPPRLLGLIIELPARNLLIFTDWDDIYSRDTYGKERVLRVLNSFSFTEEGSGSD